MATTSKSRYTGDSPGYIVVFRRIRRSFLLSFATFGLACLLILGPLFALLGSNHVSGIFAATGVILFVINITGYGLYKLMERYY